MAEASDFSIGQAEAFVVKSHAAATRLSPSRVSGWTVAACIPCIDSIPQH